MFDKLKQHLRAFTLIELVVVIGILAILAAIVIIAVNPARQFAQSRNAARRSDITQILNAVYQHAADNNGVITALITTSSLEIGTCGTCANLGTILVPNYISAIPVDPSNGTLANTKYFVVRDATTSRVTVSAPVPPTGSAELAAVISITR